MNRWLLIGSLAGLLIASTGCLHHNTRSGCSTCSTGCSTGNCGDGLCGGTGDCGMSDCGSGGCGQGACQGGCNSSGIIGHLGSKMGGNCGAHGCRQGCVAGPLGWQQGGLNYSSHLNPGVLGCRAGAQLHNRPFTPGPPTAQVAYPYYTVRGPRDFLLDNPPSIGR